MQEIFVLSEALLIQDAPKKESHWIGLFEPVNVR